MSSSSTELNSTVHLQYSGQEFTNAVIHIQQDCLICDKLIPKYLFEK